MQLHEPGICDGVGFEAFDPYAEDLYGEQVWGWWCDCAFEAALMDI